MDNANQPYPTACHMFYNRKGLVCHGLMALIATGCFTFVMIKPAMWMMRPTTSHKFDEKSVIYYNAFRGFGSDSGCTKDPLISICPGEMFSCFCHDFCWYWNNPAPWRAVDHLPNIHSNMKIETATLWLIAPYLIILCSMIGLLGTLLICLSHNIDQNTRMTLLWASQQQQLLSNDEEQEEQSIFCLDPANAALVCFCATSFLSHGFLLAVSLSDTQNPWIWQQFIQYFSPSSHFNSPPIEISFTLSGWVFVTGTVLSYLIWIGMLFVWIRFPQCVLSLPPPSSDGQDSPRAIELVSPSNLPPQVFSSFHSPLSNCPRSHTSPERERELEDMRNPLVDLKEMSHRRFETV